MVHNYTGLSAPTPRGTPAFVPGTVFTPDMVNNQVVVTVRDLESEGEPIIMIASGTMTAYAELPEQVAFYLVGSNSPTYYDPRKATGTVEVIPPRNPFTFSGGVMPV